MSLFAGLGKARRAVMEMRTQRLERQAHEQELDSAQYLRRVAARGRIEESERLKKASGPERKPITTSGFYSPFGKTEKPKKSKKGKRESYASRQTSRAEGFFR